MTAISSRYFFGLFEISHRARKYDADGKENTPEKCPGQRIYRNYIQTKVGGDEHQ